MPISSFSKFSQSNITLTGNESYAVPKINKKSLKVKLEVKYEYLPM